MRKILTILLILISANSIAQNLKGYKVEALKSIETFGYFVIGGDTLRGTTAINTLDSLLVTKEFLKIGLVDVDTLQTRALQVDSALWIQYVPNGSSDTVLIMSGTNQIKKMSFNDREGYYEHEIPSNGADTFGLPWSMRSTTMVFYNQKLIRKAWVSGTDEITIDFPVQKYDYVTIIR